MLYFIKNTSTCLRGSYYSFENKYIKNAPIYCPNIKNVHDKNSYDNIVKLVDVMLDLKKKIQAAAGSEKERIHQQINQTGHEIDELVYKLYGLTKEEIKVVNGNME